ncbi:LCP family protein [Robertmurraya andreesenii]|uniref:Regulatory protein MsrR n=1 Tax=Anoxybacillus andreesenii TaxID=1325932 RepID=A0ABT9UYM5_9BACL|nr:LCP family protein [Robertmurraya andreesenii]MDQ0153801.1 LCP family protein required for cell wall assembly [Robertmurraya andreesenii]
MRYERHKKKKKKKWKAVLFVILLFIVGGFAYSYFQYKQGVSQSLEKAKNTVEQKEYKFNGKKDRYGGTNVLLLGSDSRGEEHSRADTIMIARYHPDKKSYKLISIMRDSYVEIPGHGKNRINTAFAKGGPELLRETIKENFDIDIQYYAIVDFEGFVQLIDEAFPKGVEVNVEKEMSHNIDVVIKPGLQYLDGEHLLGYVRFRHDKVGDFGRVQRQQEVVKQIGKQLTGIQTIPKLPKLIGVVTPFINTNMDTGDMLYIGKDFLSKDNRNIDSLRVPVDGAWEDADVNGAEVLAIDVEKNKEAIREFLQK